MIARTLASNDQDLGGAVDRSAALLRTLSSRAGAIRASLAGLPPALDATSATLGRARRLIAPADRLLSEAAPAVRQLPAASSELQTALSAASPALTRAADVATAAPRASRSLMPVLHAAGPLLAVMIPVLRRLGPMLDQLRVRFPDTFSSFSNWADFTSNYDANGHGARVGIVLAAGPDPTRSRRTATAAVPPPARAPVSCVTPGSLEGQPWRDYYKSFVASPRKP